MAKKTTNKKAAKRELTAQKDDKRYVRRDSGGRFDESDDVADRFPGTGR